MIPATFQSTFNAWLDMELSSAIPGSVIAFCFNLSEPWSIEIIGSDTYSEEDPDWATDESFRPDSEPLSLPETEFGTTWEDILEGAKAMVVAYLARPSAGSEILRNAEAVAIGFVDGELSRLWPS